MNEERRIENIPIEKIIPNIYQPRIKFDNDSIEELSKSIKVHGIIQPLILRKIGEKYEIVDGERRYKAAKKAEIKTLPSIVLEISEEEAAELILTENMQKQKLTPIEEANAYQQLMLLNNFDITEIAEKLGKEKITIENKLKLLTLHPEIQEALLNNKISEGHAKALTKIDNRTKQLELYNKILEERIPVKELEEMIKNPFNQKKEKENKAEVEFMDNSQLNFNQYNDLLKEQEKPEMAATTTPEPILSSMSNQVNNFFPSLEDQPLNIGVPVANEEIPAPMEMPQFVVGEQSIQVPEAPMAPEIPTPPMEVPQTQETMAMPQFEVPAPTMPVPEAPVAPEIPTPVMEVPQTQETMVMPQFEVPAPTMPVPEAPVASEMPTPVMEVPQTQETMAMPQFEVPSPTMPVSEAPVAPEIPVMEVPQTQETMAMPQFEVPAPTMPVPEAPVAPEMPTPVMEVPQTQETMAMPQFEVPSPTMPVSEAPVAPEMPTSVMKVPQTSVNMEPAVNMIKNLIPLLGNAGYNVVVEESDTPGEHQFIIKVQK